MRASFDRPCLGHKKGSHIERMGRQFDDARLIILVGAGDLKTCVLQLLSILRVESEIAVVGFRGPGGVARDCGFTARFQSDLHRLSDQGTTQRGDKKTRRIGVGFGVSCLGKANHISGIFKDGVLEAPTRSDEGHAILSRITNARESSFETLIGAAGATEQSLKSMEFVGLIGGQPRRCKGPFKSMEGVLDAVVGGDMSGVRGIEVAEDPDSDWLGHPTSLPNAGGQPRLTGAVTFLLN
jgi:hypothetical protein